MSHNANVAVFGAGPVGLLYINLEPITNSLTNDMICSTMAVCKALGARRILAVDIQENRLEFAKGYAETDIHKAIAKLPGEDQMTYSKRHVSLSNLR